MGGFKASNAVEALDFDFRPVVEAHGTIPEPSQGELEAFLDALAEITREEGAGEDELEPGEVADAVSKALADEGLVKQFWPKVLDALEPICKGTPSRAQIEGLPARLRLAFFDWLTREFTDPTKPSVGSRPGPVRSNGAGLPI